jgi:peptide/nickel transport system permease protein
MRGRIFSRHPVLAIGALLTCLMGLLCTLSLIWTPYEPDAIDVVHKLMAPSLDHWFGTDHFGRDVASMIMVGARNSIGVASLAVAIGLCGGGALGIVAALRRGWLEELVMRLTDLTFAFPALLTAVLVSALNGPGAINVVLAIGIFNIAVFARVTRGATIQLLPRPFLRAASALGKTPFKIALDHLAPNIASVLLVQATIQFSIAILAEAGLSYLGLGVQPPNPSLGRMLSDAQTFMFISPAQALFPGIAIATVVLGLNLLGDGLRDLLDPRLKVLRVG